MGKKTSQSPTLSKDFIGYGHYRLTVTDHDGSQKAIITGNMDLIQRLSSELDKEREKAIEEAITYVEEQSL